MQSGGHHYHGFRWFRFVGVFWEHIAELVFVGFGHNHSPETIFDVEFAKEDGFRIGFRSAKDVDDASEHRTELIHGVPGGGVRVGKFVHCCSGASFPLTLAG